MTIEKDLINENVIYVYGKVHELKTWVSHYNAIVNGTKTFEVRKNDRDFKVGDTLLLREYSPIRNEYTGACITKKVGYILFGGKFGIEEGYIVMGLH